MQKPESVNEEATPNARVGHFHGESQIPPTSSDRVGMDEAATGVDWGDFLLNLPDAAHVASTAPTARFGSHMSFQTAAATRFALGGINRGEKVLVIGSRWQYLEILRGLEDLLQYVEPNRGRSAWRNRDLEVFEANELRSRLLVDSIPDGMRFASFIEGASESARGIRRVRVWNSLGARFRESGEHRASHAMERLWHQARRHLGVHNRVQLPSVNDGPRTASHMEPSRGCHTHLIRSSREGVTVERIPPASRESLDST